MLKYLTLLKGNGWRNIALLILSGFSGFATFDGLRAFFADDQAGFLDAETIAALGLSAGIMMTLVATLHAALMPRALFGKMFFIFSYLLFTTLSITFGFAFYWEKMRADQVTEDSFAQSREQISAAVDAMQGRMVGLTEVFQALADYSERRRVEEEERGGTCDVKTRGAGPRMRLRESDAELFAEMARHYRDKASDLEPVLTKLRQLARQTVSDQAAMLREQLSQQVMVANQKAKSPLHQTHQMQLDDRIAKGRSGITTTTGATFQCPDERLENLMRAALGSMDLGTVPMPDIVNTEGSRGKIEAVKRLGHFLLAKVAGVADVSLIDTSRADTGERMETRVALSKELQDDDALPLVLAIIVDFGIFVFALAKARSPLSGLAELGQPGVLPPGLFDGCLARLREGTGILQALAPFRFRYRGYRMIAVPRGVREPDVEAVDALMAYLGKHGLATTKLVASFLVRRSLRQEKSPYADAGSYDTYRLNGELWPELVKESLAGLNEPQAAQPRQDAAPSSKDPAPPHPDPAPSAERPGTPADASTAAAGAETETAEATATAKAGPQGQEQAGLQDEQPRRSPRQGQWRPRPDWDPDAFWHNLRRVKDGGEQG